MGDLTIKCVEPECGRDFIFTQGEQDFFKRKNLFFPKRCPACRVKKREEKAKMGLVDDHSADSFVKPKKLGR